MALLHPTKMVDFALEVAQSLGDPRPKEISTLESKRNMVLKELNSLKQACCPMLDLLDQQEDLLKQLHASKMLTPGYLAERHGISIEHLDGFFRYAKFQYECGNYQDALAHLSYYCAIMPSSSPSYVAAMWGKLACEILLEQYNEAMCDLTNLMDLIESESVPLKLLQERTWLLHWALFLFACSSDHRDAVIDLMFQQRCLEAIQTNTPWLLRYLTVGVIVHKRRRQLTKDLIKILQQERNTYRDPLIEFVENLYVDFDFDSAEEKLRACETVLQSDFFLQDAIGSDFMENARIFMFETYCRIHEKIDIAMLAKKLAMDGADAEKWVVDLIRNARLDAKINSQEHVILMCTSSNSVHQQLVEKTRELAARTCNLSEQLARMTKERRRR